ncbi:phasin family protein (plasmid) [Bradyrhizobium sp. LCT2]|uniref:phasin family protein n=1 Tax=Bradyrhizobium sp. LCT2 TaxID=2493093 RepID=UPI0013745C76|nr:phasin family protein [Bradyrhizobium sp. LCT2]QHP66108.1 phasin family protein [Bradyrhizobium sp. LCT2]
MANLRQDDKSTPGTDDAARRAGEQTSRTGQAAAGQTAHVGQGAAQPGEETARSTSNFLKQNLETVQNAWRIGLEATTLAVGRSTEQLGRTLGVSGEGGQRAKEATERSARNAQTILYTSNAAAKVVNGMSQEYSQMVQHQVGKNMDYIRELWTCRTPQEFVAAQSDIVRESVEIALEGSRRIADLSLKVADETGKQIK